MICVSINDVFERLICHRAHRSCEVPSRYTTQEKISTDFEVTVSVRQGNIRVGIHLFLRQEIVQALTCFGSQGFIPRLDIFGAQTKGQVSTRQPLNSVFQLQVTQKHGAIDMTDDKSQIFVHICSQQHWSWRVQHSNVKYDFPGQVRHRQNTRRHVLLSVRRRKNEVKLHAPTDRIFPAADSWGSIGTATSVGPQKQLPRCTLGWQKLEEERRGGG